MRRRDLQIGAVEAALFGADTLVLNRAVIFNRFSMGEKEGNYLSPVVGTNFVCGLLFLPAALGFFKNKSWPVLLLTVSVILLVVAFAGLVFHIIAGGVYETKTIGALLFRVGLTLGFLVLGSRILSGILGKEMKETYR